MDYTVLPCKSRRVFSTASWAQQLEINGPLDITRLFNTQLVVFSAVPPLFLLEGIGLGMGGWLFVASWWWPLFHYNSAKVGGVISPSCPLRPRLGGVTTSMTKDTEAK